MRRVSFVSQFVSDVEATQEHWRCVRLLAFSYMLIACSISSTPLAEAHLRSTSTSIERPRGLYTLVYDPLTTGRHYNGMIFEKNTPPPPPPLPFAPYLQFRHVSNANPRNVESFAIKAAFCWLLPYFNRKSLWVFSRSFFSRRRGHRIFY